MYGEFTENTKTYPKTIFVFLKPRPSQYYTLRENILDSSIFLSVISNFDDQKDIHPK